PSSPPHPHLHSFPTRRSSDLTDGCLLPRARDRPDPPSTARGPAPGGDPRPDHLVPAPIAGLDPDRLRQRRGYVRGGGGPDLRPLDRKSTRLNSSHVKISYAVF